MPLFSKKLDVISFDIEKPVAHLHRDAKGRWNLVSLIERAGASQGPATAAAPAGGGIDILIEQFRLIDGTLDVSDAAIVPGTIHRIEGRAIQLTLSDLSTTSPMRIDLKLGLSGSGKGALAGTLGPPPKGEAGAWPIDARVTVTDFIGGAGSHDAAVHWHLDPRWTAAIRARGAVFTRDGDTRDRVGLTVAHGTVDAFVADQASGLGWHSPAYGRVDRTTTVRVRYAAAAPFWIVSVFDLDAENPVADVDWVPVWAEAGALDHAAAIRITRATSIDHVLFAEPVPGGHAGPTLPTDVGADRRVAPDRSGSVWRVADVETDARMLMCRVTVGRPLVCLASVDATTARTRNLELLNPGPLEPLNPDVSSPCAASPAS
jgi:hypothetical protein